VLPDGSPADDSWSMWRGGFRYDWEPTAQNLLTLQGDSYTGDLNQAVTVPLLSPPYSAELRDKVNVSGGNVLGRWNHQFSDNADLALKLYYDRTKRDRVVFAERRDTLIWTSSITSRWVTARTSSLALATTLRLMN